MNKLCLALLTGICAWTLGCSDAAPTPDGAAGAAGGGAAGAGGSVAGAAGSGGQAGSAGAGGSASGAGGGAGAQGGGGSSSGGGSAGEGGSAAGSGGAGGGAAGGGAAGGGAGGQGGAPGPTADYQLYGRWNVATLGRAVTVNSGSHVTASFTGTGISAKFDISANTGTRPTVSFKVDEGAWVEKEISQTLELASGLPAGEHSVQLFVRGMSEFESRWSPPLVASTVFTGFNVTGGSLVPQPRPARKKVEFLGDSITEGVLVHSAGPQGQTSAAWRCDGVRNYAGLTGAALGAEWRQVGFGRQGLTKGGNGGVPVAQDAFSWFYSGVARDDWQADLVIINQGTNDAGTNGQTFASLYRQLLGVVRAAYPAARIVALRPLNGSFASEISAQVKALRDGGDASIFYIDTSGWTTGADFTDGVHPNLSGSAKISQKLVAALMALPE